MKQEEKRKMLKPHSMDKNWEPVTKRQKIKNCCQIFHPPEQQTGSVSSIFQHLELELLQESPVSTHGSTASPQRGVVELDPQQVPHAGLGWVVHDVLVVQEGVSVATTHPGLHAGANRHRHAVSGGTKSENCQASEFSWVLEELLCGTESVCGAFTAPFVTFYTWQSALRLVGCGFDP